MELHHLPFDVLEIIFGTYVALSARDLCNLMKAYLYAQPKEHPVNRLLHRKSGFWRRLLWAHINESVVNFKLDRDVMRELIFQEVAFAPHLYARLNMVNRMFSFRDGPAFYSGFLKNSVDANVSDKDEGVIPQMFCPILIGIFKILTVLHHVFEPVPYEKDSINVHFENDDVSKLLIEYKAPHHFYYPIYYALHVTVPQFLDTRVYMGDVDLELKSLFLKFVRSHILTIMLDASFQHECAIYGKWKAEHVENARCLRSVIRNMGQFFTFATAVQDVRNRCLLEDGPAKNHLHFYREEIDPAYLDSLNDIEEQIFLESVANVNSFPSFMFLFQEFI